MSFLAVAHAARPAMRKACESGSSAKKAPSENEAEEGQEKQREGGTGKLVSPSSRDEWWVRLPVPTHLP